MNDYVPKRGLRNGHAMTVYCWARRRTFPRLPAPTERHFDVERGTRVLAHCYWQPAPASRPVLLALHGLEGSSSAHYMRGLADKAFARGFNVILLNQRNCGGTEHLAETLYHSGLTHDADRVIHEMVGEGIERIVVAGYSLGGNLALKLAGDYGDAPPAGSPRRLRGVAGARVGRVRPRARAAAEFCLPVEFRPRAQGPHAAQGADISRGGFAVMRLADVRTVRAVR